MLDRLQQHAARIHWLRKPLIGVAVFAVIFVTYVATNSGEGSNDQLLIPLILLFCWSGLAYCFINLFQVVPPKANSQLNFLRRQLARFRRALLTIVALGFLVLTGALVVVSFKLITTGLG